MSKIISRPGPRFMYPELVDSRSLARCGLVANALWPRLIVRADDQGRMAGDAGSILVTCFPKLLHLVTLDQVEAALGELAGVGMAVIYDVKGETYLQIAEWWRWQQGMRRAYASRFPAPRGWVDVVFGSDGQATTFAKALEAGHFVLSRGYQPTAARGQRARRVPAVRPHTAVPRARAGSVPDPTRPVDTRPNPSGTAREARAPVDTDRAKPDVPTNGARLVGNAYDSFEVLTGKAPTAKVMTWLDDECKRYGREHVVTVMYATPEPAKSNWMNRVKDALRGKPPPAPDADSETVDFGGGEEPASHA